MFALFEQIISCNFENSIAMSQNTAHKEFSEMRKLRKIKEPKRYNIVMNNITELIKRIPVEYALLKQQKFTSVVQHNFDMLDSPFGAKRIEGGKTLHTSVQLLARDTEERFRHMLDVADQLASFATKTYADRPILITLAHKLQQCVNSHRNMLDHTFVHGGLSRSSRPSFQQVMDGCLFDLDEKKIKRFKQMFTPKLLAKLKHLYLTESNPDQNHDQAIEHMLEVLSRKRVDSVVDAKYIGLFVDCMAHHIPSKYKHQFYVLDQKRKH